MLEQNTRELQQLGTRNFVTSNKRNNFTVKVNLDKTVKLQVFINRVTWRYDQKTQEKPTWHINFSTTFSEKWVWRRPPEFPRKLILPADAWHSSLSKSNRWEETSHSQLIFDLTGNNSPFMCTYLILPDLLCLFFYSNDDCVFHFATFLHFYCDHLENWQLSLSFNSTGNIGF